MMKDDEDDEDDDDDDNDDDDDDDDEHTVQMDECSLYQPTTHTHTHKQSYDEWEDEN